jgi:hypothetical protein
MRRAGHAPAVGVSRWSQRIEFPQPRHASPAGAVFIQPEPERDAASPRAAGPSPRVASSGSPRARHATQKRATAAILATDRQAPGAGLGRPLAKILRGSVQPLRPLLVRAVVDRMSSAAPPIHWGAAKCHHDARCINYSIEPGPPLCAALNLRLPLPRATTRGGRKPQAAISARQGPLSPLTFVSSATARSRHQARA